MKWHWFRRSEHHPCRIVFIPAGLDDLNGEVWCNTHEQFYQSSDSNTVLLALGVAHVSQYPGRPDDVLVYGEK